MPRRGLVRFPHCATYTNRKTAVKISLVGRIQNQLEIPSAQKPTHYPSGLTTANESNRHPRERRYR